ncbi:PLP-dependent cysteine synthase family protein [Roseibacillus ishigakijimensis]|uniref:cysteine synthase n=1 Tax=Roseibacillus ishigakijimensis TaxID=454146 RepID=A0A934RP90_9BACT|nr:cysteine synthase family protein [Roseibacillus ishigakijimensis]MBK1833051.1 cysteine synthase family protein [Roseibacillus ishigakijimensis]
MTTLAPPHRPVLDLIGNTPLLRLRFEPEGLEILAKAEFLNPSGSVKDRLARCLILDAEARGELTPDSLILECTSGNTGISLAMIGAACGYRVKILMSDSASVERRNLIRQLGAELELFACQGSYQAGIDLAEDVAARDARIFLPRQFANPLNARDHYETTAREIIAQTSRPVQAFVSGYGTGGTIAGTGQALKEKWPDLEVVCMEPGGDALPGEFPCCHRIEGVSVNFQPRLLASAPIDRKVAISGQEAMATTRRLHRDFGLLVGTSSGANIAAALRVARELGPTSQVVTILCDRAERYFSTSLFQPQS